MYPGLMSERRFDAFALDADPLAFAVDVAAAAVFGKSSSRGENPDGQH